MDAGGRAMPGAIAERVRERVMREAQFVSTRSHLYF